MSLGMGLLYTSRRGVRICSSRLTTYPGSGIVQREAQCLLYASHSFYYRAPDRSAVVSSPSSAPPSAPIDMGSAQSGESSLWHQENIVSRGTYARGARRQKAPKQSPSIASATQGGAFSFIPTKHIPHACGGWCYSGSLPKSLSESWRMRTVRGLAPSPGLITPFFSSMSMIFAARA